MTAALGLYKVLALPLPWCQPPIPCPVLIYGASSAVGAFAIKMAMLSNIHPINAVAWQGAPFVSSLIDETRGDAVFDYHGKCLQQDIKSHLAGLGFATAFKYALDVIVTSQSSKLCSSQLEDGGKLGHTLPLPEDLQISEGVSTELIKVGCVHGQFEEKLELRDFGAVMMQLFGRWLAHGELKGHPYKIIPGGLSAVPVILQSLKDGKPSAIKYIFHPADGLSSIDI